MTRRIDRYYLNGQGYMIKFPQHVVRTDFPELDERDRSSPITNTQGGWSEGVVFNSDGSKLFVGGVGNSAIYYEDLNTPYMINSFNTGGSVSFNVSSRGGCGTVGFTPDGSYAFVGGNFQDGTGADLQKLALSTPYDLTSYTVDSYDTTYADCFPRGFCFSPDGTKLFGGVSGQNGYLACYEMSTPWDITTLNRTASASLVPGEAGGFCFDDNGTSAYVVCYANATLYRFSLSTPWDITTMTETSSRSIGSINGVGCVNDSGTWRLYLCLGYTDLQQYGLLE